MNIVSAKELPGKMYIFLNKRKDKVKALYWDNDGFAIWYKQLQKGVFGFPDSNENYIELPAEILHQIFLGFDLKFLKKHKRFSL